MAQLTSAQMIDELAAMLGAGAGSGDDARTTLLRALNIGARRVWNARNWGERMKEGGISTIAAYSTGTLTFTNASTTVTGSGTSWTGWGSSVGKIALGLSSPFYVVSTNAGVTSIVTARAYLEDTVSASNYVLYADEYDLATDVHSLLDVTLLSSRLRGPVRLRPQRALDRDGFIPGSSGRPIFHCMATPVTAGTKRIRVWPVPDDEYRIRYKYVAEFTDLTDGSGTPGYAQDLEWAVLKAAALVGQVSVGTSVTNEAEVEALIQAAWLSRPEAHPLVGRRLPMGRRSNNNFTMDLGGLSS